MSLPGRKPAIEENKRAKIILSGKSGIGKSFFACQFPNVYYWDTEDGANREQYQKMLLENGSFYIGKKEGSENFKALISAVKELATTKHHYKTLVIDSLSHLFLLEAAIVEDKLISQNKPTGFSADKKGAEIPARQLKRWLDKVDMNVIMICYLDNDWQNGENIGTKFVGPKFIDHLLDLWIETRMANGKRIFEVKKTRLDSFPLGSFGKLDFKSFSEQYGLESINKDSSPIILATEGQVKELKEIVKSFEISEEIQNKWLKQADVERFEDFSKEIIEKIINHYKGAKK